MPPWPPLRLHLFLQGWVFNVVPWLLAIPASLFSGFISDRLISQGKRWGKLSWVSHSLENLTPLSQYSYVTGERPPPCDTQTIL